MSLKEFDIELSKIRNGQNHYTYRLEPVFFENFDNQTVKSSNIEIDLELEKSDRLVNLTFNIKGSLSLDCEKCLAAYQQPVDHISFLIVKITDEEQPKDEEDEIIYLSRKENCFNIGQHIYDFVMLALPFVKTCAEPGNLPECDKEMLAKLEILSHPHTNEAEPDERWSKLKDFLSNN